MTETRARDFINVLVIDGLFVPSSEAHFMCVEKRLAAALEAERKPLERELRQRMWTLHYSRMQHVPYGDDGCLDCNTCLRDYATTPMETLRQWEMLDAAQAIEGNPQRLRWSTANPTAEDFQWYLWRPDKTARPYAVMYFHGVWKFGSYDWTTPDHGEWCPVPMPEEGK